MGKQQHIAFYLPQFHPIPENDDWWGPGFTEWTNVTRARPRFRGHHQPHLPRDLGFYDLRLPEARSAQAELATRYGIDGFCYYHYWFADGRRLLERPFDEVLASGSPDFPFCLAWANENWTRSWDGEERSVLVAQEYAGHERAHGRWLARAFADDRYIRVDGKPVFLVYRASQLPDPVGMTRVWRDEARAAGVGEIYLLRIESFPDERTDPRPLGFDAAVEFAPDLTVVGRDFWSRAVPYLRQITTGLGRGRYKAIDYQQLVDRMLAKPTPPYLRFPGVTPNWDNSARKHHRAAVLTGSTPERYARWVTAASKAAPTTPAGDSLVFVNAWNEWAEGAHLEPDQRWGLSYLEAHLAGRLEAFPEFR